MPARHDSWTALYASYHEQPHTRELIATELAAVCLVLRDAEWASDIHPFCSHGQLGLSTAPNTRLRVNGALFGLELVKASIPLPHFKRSSVRRRSKRSASLSCRKLRCGRWWCGFEEAASEYQVILRQRVPRDA
jgi:hypothetical protein